MLAGSPKSAGRGRSERESRVSSAGRAVTIRMRKGRMDRSAHTAGLYRCASRARLRLHGAVSFASRGSLPTDHRAREVECEGSELPAQPHRRTRIHDAYHRNNSTQTARIGRRCRVPVGMASVASQRPTARVTVCRGGSAKFRPLTCDRRRQHTISAKTCAVF
jgi:hypothetical protein